MRHGNSIGQLYGLMAEGLYQKEDFDAQGNLLSRTAGFYV